MESSIFPNGLANVRLPRYPMKNSKFSSKRHYKTEVCKTGQLIKSLAAGSYFRIGSKCEDRIIRSYSHCTNYGLVSNRIIICLG